MGNQTSIYIHLDQMDGYSSKPNHYKITFNSEPYSECQFFKKVTYRITYDVEFPRVARATEFYIFFTKRTWTVVNFSYYPYSSSDVIVEVYCFYSRLRLDEPLVLGFKTRNHRIQYYRYMDLDFKSSTGLPPNGFKENAILYNLQMENQKLNKKLTFYVARGSNVHINGIPGEEDPKPNYSGRFKRVFRKANIDSDFKGHRDGPWAFYSSELFTLNRAKNKIDDKFLKPFHNKTFYAIYVYYTYDDELAVLIELVKDFNDIIFLARRDEDGDCWEKIDYNKTTETELDNKLQFLEREFRYPWLYNRHGPCKPIEYVDPGPVDFKNCNLVHKKKPAEKPREVVVEKEITIPGKETPIPGREITIPSKETPIPGREITIPSKETPIPGRETPPTTDDILSSPEITSSPSPPPKTRIPDTRRPTAPPSVSPPTYIKKPEPVTIKIDILKTTSESTYDSGNVQLYRKDYEDCDLFCYFTHTPSVKDFKTISFELGRDKTIRIHSLEVTKLLSVSVFFNRDYLNKPLILKTETSNVVRYYKDLSRSDTSYIVFEDSAIVSRLSDSLIEENDKVNSTITCQIDRRTIKGKLTTYGHNNSINLTFEKKEKLEFSFYSHKLKTGKSFKGYVLFNKNKLLGWSNNSKTPLNIQNKDYTAINVYVLNSDENSLLLVELIDGPSKSYYGKIVDEVGEYWTNTIIKPNSDESIKLKLIELNYPLKNSAIIEIDQKNPDRLKEFNYQLKMISNKRTSKNKYEKNQYKESKPVDSKKVLVSFANNLTDRSITGKSPFFYVSHQLEDSSHPSINRKEISGVRLFMNSIKNAQPEEIFFYKNEKDAKESKNYTFFYYPTESNLNRIYAYFYHEDPRVLLISYNGIAYKRLNSDDDSKWVSAGPVTYSKFDQVLKILMSIFGTMDKKITLVKEGTMDSNIMVKRGEKIGEFIYDHYSVKFGGKRDVTSLKLPIKNLVQDLNNGTVLYDMFEKLYHNPFDSIRVYKVDTSLSLNSILLFELVSGNQKTHISRRDADSNFWDIRKFTEEISEKLLSTIKSESFDTVIYEINNRTQYTKRIQVNQDLSFSKYGFTKITHSITDGTYKRATIFYQGNYLLEKTGTDSYNNLSASEFNVYGSVTVFFGSKSKSGAGFNPLFIQLIKNTSIGYFTTYYHHKRKSNKYYWERLNINFKFTEDLVSHLKKTEFDLCDSTVVLMNKINENYGDVEITNAIKNLNEHKEINLGRIDHQSIQVVNKVDSVSCFSQYGFTVYEHDISRIPKADKIGIRFFMFTSDINNKFSDLSLFNQEELLDDYLYFDESHEKAYVFFYSSDRRPLLLVYGNNGYRPSSIDSYDVKWVKIKGKIDINCNLRYNILLKELSDVVGLLNSVNINEFPEVYQINTPNTYVSSTSEYYLRNYNGHKIHINVSYMNMSCYRCYTLTSMDSGYRLGNLTVNNRIANIIPYQMSKQLKNVKVYFNVFDTFLQYPLLVVLGFENDFEEYYRLNDKSRMVWTTFGSDKDIKLLSKLTDKEKLEEGLYDLRQDLKITFDTNSKDYLFDPEKCKEGASNTTVIAAATGGVVGTAATVGTGVGVAYATFPQLFVPVINALV